MNRSLCVSLLILSALAGVSVVAGPLEAAAATSSPDDAMANGKGVFNQVCAACHQANAMGMPGAFPPLAASDYLNGDPKRAIGIVLNGLSERITVNGTAYQGVMPGQGSHLSDQQIANVLTYVLNNFSNKGGTISPADVAAMRNVDKK